MADYIKRVDALKAATLAELDADFVIEAIHRIPAADVRPVILCENCIYLPNGTCRIPFLKSDESYCSWGRDYREAQDECDSDSCPIHFKDENRTD